MKKNKGGINWDNIKMGALASIPGILAVGAMGSLIANAGRYDNNDLEGGKRGVPNPPKIHWTSVVKAIKNTYNLDWKHALKKWKDMGKPNPTFNIEKKEKPKILDIHR